MNAWFNKFECMLGVTSRFSRELVHGCCQKKQIVGKAAFQVSGTGRNGVQETNNRIRILTAFIFAQRQPCSTLTFTITGSSSYTLDRLSALDSKFTLLHTEQYQRCSFVYGKHTHSQIPATIPVNAEKGRPLKHIRHAPSCQQV